MIIRLVLMAAGVLLLVSAGRLAPAIDRIAGKTAVRKGADSFPGEEDDILDNKTKWKVLIAGYIVFALVAVFSLLSIFTLNKKINTLYNSVQRLESEAGSVP